MGLGRVGGLKGKGVVLRWRAGGRLGVLSELRRRGCRDRTVGRLVLPVKRRRTLVDRLERGRLQGRRELVGRSLTGGVGEAEADLETGRRRRPPSLGRSDYVAPPSPALRS